MTATQKKIIKRLLAGERLITPEQFGHQWHWNGGKHDGPDYNKPCIQGATIEKNEARGLARQYSYPWPKPRGPHANSQGD